MDYSKQSIKDLISICKANGIKGYSGMKQAEIANLVKANLPEGNTIQAEAVPQQKQAQQPMQESKEQSNEDLLQAVLKKQTIKKTAAELNLATGTVQRWLELKNVPPQYRFDLFRLLNTEVDYSKYSSNQKDQFFTPTSLVDKCWATFLEKTSINPKDYIFIEPSAGDGSFLKALPKNSMAFDIEPRHHSVKKQDYLTWCPTPPTNKTKDQKYIVFGNPPFGLRGHVALHFINHSAAFADYVCFILPQLFESDGKGSPRKRVKGYNLIHSEKVGALFYTPERADVTVNGVFQIWSKHVKDEKYTLDNSVSNLVKVYSLSDGGTPSSTRNKEMLDKCDIYLPSTCFGKENMRLYNSFKELPKKGYGVVFLKDKERLLEKAKKVDWSAAAFLSTNSMFNLRTSIITATLSSTS